MPIQFRCRNDECAKVLTVSEGMAGKNAKCPKCGEVQPVRSAGETRRAQAIPEETDPRDRDEDRPRRRREEEDGSRSRRDDDDDRPRRRTEEDDDEPSARKKVKLLCPGCGANIEAEDEDCPRCRFPLDSAAMKADLRNLKSQRLWYQIICFALGLPAVALTALTVYFYRDDLTRILAAALVTGILLFLSVMYAVAHRKFNLLWSLFGFLGLIGLIVVILLPDDKGKRVKRYQKLLDARRRLARAEA